MKKSLILLAVSAITLGPVLSCREAEEKKVIIQEEEGEDEGILEKAGREVDEEVNEEVDETIDDIGDDN